MNFKRKNKHQRNIITSSTIGTLLEWYDFTVYAYLAPIISHLFFPSDNPYSSLMLTFSVFAMGYVIRPLGAVLFGHLGDKLGRRKALILAIFLITFATFLIGVLPTYETIGVIAPILLICCRLLQGLSVGGETIGAASFVFESETKNRGLFTGIVWASSGFGILLGSLVASLISLILSESQIFSFGWRLPFLISLITGVSGLYLRTTTSESLEFLRMKQQMKVSASPFFEVLQGYKKDILKISGLYVLCTYSIYLIYVYMPTYAYSILGMNFNQSSLINTGTMLIMVTLVPIFGHLSDKISRDFLLICAALLFFLLSYPLYGLLTHNSLLNLFLVQFIFAIITSAYHGSITAKALESFPIRVRYTAAAISYNFSYAIFGGTAPLVVSYFIHSTGNLLVPAFFLSIGALVTLVIIPRKHMRRSAYRNN